MQQIFKKYVSFKYRAHNGRYELHCVHSDGSGDRSHCPFYDWQASRLQIGCHTILGCAALSLSRRGTKCPTCESGCQAPRPGCSAQNLLYRAKRPVRILPYIQLLPWGRRPANFSSVGFQRYLKVGPGSSQRSSGLCSSLHPKALIHLVRRASAPASTGYLLSGYPAPSCQKALHPPR